MKHAFGERGFTGPCVSAGRLDQGSAFDDA